jgi:glycerol-3-phosphate O-acyltransferase/dihydroxyacetone phosphate acyltransferase
MVVELNRRLVKGYTRYKDDPRIIGLKKAVLAYNKQLLQLNLRDHQVEYARLPILNVIFTLFYRLSKLILLSAGVLPGLVLFSPIFIAGKLISIQKSREALAASTVKIQARDVIATWKLLVSLALAPALYTFYTLLLTYWTYRNRVQGYMPDYVPLWAVVVFGYIFFPTITYAALRFGETGMDIAKSIRPLFIALSPAHGNMLVRIRERRAALSSQVTELINTLGPEMFPDFDATRVVADPFRDGGTRTPGATSPTYPTSRHDSNASMSGFLSDEPTTPNSPQHISFSFQPSSEPTSAHSERNESFKSLSNIGLFASRPGTPHHNRSRSRTNSSGFPIHVQSFSNLSEGDTKASLEEVSQKIRGAMRERGARRRSETERMWGEESGGSTPGSEDEGGGGLRMTSAKGGDRKKDE